MDAKPLEPRVLGQLLLMQSLLNHLPDTKAIFSFVVKGLLDIPGISRVQYYEPELANYEISPDGISFTITSGHSDFGRLSITFSDKNTFLPYQNYLENFVFMLGVILEERRQRKINEEHTKQLEDKVRERSAELLREKENLLESERRFTDLLKNVRLLSMMLDTQGTIIFCNQFLLTLTGYTAEEVIGKNWFALFLPPENREEISERFSQVIEGREPSSNYENEILTRTGERLLIAWNNTTLRDLQKNIIGTASIGENITDRKRAEIELKEKTEEIEAQNEEYQQINEELFQLNQELMTAKERAEESDRLKTAFLQNMSHEIRTPMNAIMGFADILKNQFDNREKLVKFTNIIYQRCRDLLNIINDILDIAKIESGQLPISIEECNLDELFDELHIFFSEFQDRMGKQHIRFTIDTRYGPHEKTILTDKVKLKQIFINLINNAFKFTQVGSIQAGCKPGQNGQLHFFVADTGVGIPPEKQKAIFDRFTQLQHQGLKNPGGTGLGLSIVKGLASLLGGDVSVQSVPGKGSEFTFSIDYKPVSSPSQHQTGPHVQQQVVFPNRTVLIVEDDAYNTEYLNELLSNKGLTLIFAENGEDAIRLSLTQAVDLVLMDVRLPDIDGYEATRRIKEEKPDVRIIAQTAYASFDEKRKALDAGCSDYISKPIAREQLLRMVKRHLA